MTSLGNGMGRAQASARSLGELTDEMASFGYELDSVTRLAGKRDYRAIAYNAEGHRAEALGTSETNAVRSLVRTLKF